MKKEDFKKILDEYVVNTHEAIEILGTSRQNIHDAIKNGYIEPLVTYSKDRLFWKPDILERKKQLELKRKK